VRDGGEAVFGLGIIAARLFGYVRDDAGSPLPGMKLTLTCGTHKEVVSSDAEGRYAVSGADAVCSLSPDASSIPAGYEMMDTGLHPVILARQDPAHVDYSLRAMRSIAGTVSVAAGTNGTAVRLLETGAARQVDARGRFVFRNLKPGLYTIRLDIDGQAIERVVVVPAGPGVTEVTLSPGK
jgi:hypothetical protein